MFHKRQSLRGKRNAHVFLERPASDSNISYTSQNLQASTQNRSASDEFPEMPSDVPAWITRRSKCNRDSPRTKRDMPPEDQNQDERLRTSPPHGGEEALYELDARPSFASETNDRSVPQTVPPREIGEYRQQNIVQCENEEDLERALILSQEEAFIAPKRTNTGGFDRDEIDEAINRSMYNR